MPDENSKWTFDALANNYPNPSFWGRHKWYNADDVQRWILHLKEVHDKEMNELREQMQNESKKIQMDVFTAIQTIEDQISSGIQPVIRNLINTYLNNIKEGISNADK